MPTTPRMSPHCVWRFVKIITGKTVTLDVEASDKAKIQNKEGISSRSAAFDLCREQFEDVQKESKKAVEIEHKDFCVEFMSDLSASVVCIPAVRAGFRCGEVRQSPVQCCFVLNVSM